MLLYAERNIKLQLNWINMSSVRKLRRDIRTILGHTRNCLEKFLNFVEFQQMKPLNQCSVIRTFLEITYLITSLTLEIAVANQ